MVAGILESTQNISDANKAAESRKKKEIMPRLWMARSSTINN